MTEVWKEAKNTIKGIASIISPSRTRTDNRYSPIGPNEEDNRSTGSNKEDQQPSKTNDQSESDSDSEYDTTMTKPEAKTIKDLVKDTSVIRPKQFPSLMDVFDFKNEVINALTLCDLRETYKAIHSS